MTYILITFTRFRHKSRDTVRSKSSTPSCSQPASRVRSRLPSEATVLLYPGVRTEALSSPSLQTARHSFVTLGEHNHHRLFDWSGAATAERFDRKSGKHLNNRCGFSWWCLSWCEWLFIASHSVTCFLSQVECCSTPSSTCSGVSHRFKRRYCL